MSSHPIPPRAKAGVAFAGAEFSEAMPLFASVFIALVAGSIWGWQWYLAVPAAGYGLNKLYLDWKNANLPGHLVLMGYRMGFASYSSAFDRQNKLFIGNGTVINPNITELTALLPKQHANHRIEAD